jgi:hypothetical protein
MFDFSTNVSDVPLRLIDSLTPELVLLGGVVLLALALIARKRGPR